MKESKAYYKGYPIIASNGRCQIQSGISRTKYKTIGGAKRAMDRYIRSRLK